MIPEVLDSKGTCVAGYAIHHADSRVTNTLHSTSALQIHSSKAVFQRELHGCHPVSICMYNQPAPVPKHFLLTGTRQNETQQEQNY
mmetsp:Transcript_48183/g.79355  ORF Transcript_48183/g.79355 Transcript_48183/m.79355 type:complete len:86 (+) Transcript_48183:611-868(+)